MINDKKLMSSLLNDKEFIKGRIELIETEGLEYNDNLKFYRGQLLVIDAYIDAIKDGDYEI